MIVIRSLDVICFHDEVFLINYEANRKFGRFSSRPPRSVQNMSGFISAHAKFTDPQEIITITSMQLAEILGNRHIINSLKKLAKNVGTDEHFTTGKSISEYKQATAELRSQLQDKPQEQIQSASSKLT